MKDNGRSEVWIIEVWTMKGLDNGGLDNGGSIVPY
jgi:hypothetical protein